jgi:hypothetical protein
MGAAVGLTSSVIELEFIVDWTVFARPEMRRGQTPSRQVTGNCRGAGWKQVESVEETL